MRRPSISRRESTARRHGIGHRDGCRAPGERLEDHGIDVTYLSRSEFDPRTLPALLADLDGRRADILHLHGYGATTLGHVAAVRRGWPVVLHEHADLTDTRGPEGRRPPSRAYTDLAIAVSRSTAEFVTRARLIPEARTRVVYLGAPVAEFAGRRASERVRAVRSAPGLPAEGPVVGRSRA